MADKRVVVVGQGSIVYDEIMDEALINAYVTDAQTAGYFESSDSDVFIPWEVSSVKILDPDDPYTS